MRFPKDFFRVVTYSGRFVTPLHSGGRSIPRPRRSIGSHMGLLDKTYENNDQQPRIANRPNRPAVQSQRNRARSPQPQ